MRPDIQPGILRSGVRGDVRALRRRVFEVDGRSGISRAPGIVRFLDLAQAPDLFGIGEDELPPGIQNLPLVAPQNALGRMRESLFGRSHVPIPSPSDIM